MARMARAAAFRSPRTRATSRSSKPQNVEVVVKVLNGCGSNSRYWTFAGGLTDVNVILTVTDMQTGAVKTYTNPQGTPFQPIQDTDAFAACP